MIAIWNQLLNANSAVDRVQILSLVARNIVLPMSARELNVVQLNEARTTIFAASLLLAAVVATGCGDAGKAVDTRRPGACSRSDTSPGIGGHTQSGVDHKEAGIRLRG